MYPTAPTGVVVQKWGNYWPAMYAGSGRHMGLDIGGLPVGSPIYAAYDGVIETASLVNAHGYGRHVIIRHDGFRTLYAHLHAVFVTVGQAVTSGFKIGEMGGQPGDDDPIDGASTGAHLHFEAILPEPPMGDSVMTFAGWTVDPIPFIMRKFYGEPTQFVKVVSNKGVRVRTSYNVNSERIGALNYRDDYPIFRAGLIDMQGNAWAHLWSIRPEYAAEKYDGEVLLEVKGYVRPEPTPDPLPNGEGENAIRLDEINRMITHLEQRKSEL